MADMQSDAGERTEAATPKKRDESRRKGSVAKSTEVNSALILLAAILILQGVGSMLAGRLMELIRTFFGMAGRMPVNDANVQTWVSQIVVFVLVTIGPIMLGLMVIGAVASVSQVGLHFYWEPMSPKFHKLNPLKGLKRLLISKHSAVELFKNLMKIVVVGFVGYSAVKGMIEDSLVLMDSDAGEVITFMTSSALSAATKMGLAFLVLAALDYAFQRYEHEESLKMTKQEVKEEGKMAEGDPQVKGRIRSIQRQIAYKRMMQDVPKADVVVTNPTHVAVALKYDVANMNAPKVIAKGAELIAQRIKEIAFAHNIPVMEDRILARTLYKTVEVGEEIPEKMFQAVAQLLAYIFRMRNAAAAAR